MLGSDLRYAARTLRKAPVFAGAAILTLALGIGANTAIFSVVNTVMLQGLPFSDPDRLIRIAEKNDKLNLPFFAVSLLNYLSWKEQQQSFGQLAAFGFSSFNLSGSGEPEQFAGGTISPSLFPTLGLKPLVGRAFQEGEDRPAASAVILISEGLWKRRFGRAPALIGRNLTLNGIDYTVIGIAPPSLPVLTGGDIWIPMLIDPAKEFRLNHTISAIGRLKPGVTIESAQSEMDAVARRVAAQYPEVKDWGIHLQSVYHWFVPDQLRTALLVLLGAVAFVLLIACANVANLLLARAASREKEIGVRTALGASRARLLGQLLTESLLLSVLGGAAGLLLAVWTVHAMNGALPPNLLPVPEIAVDTSVLLFAFAVTIVTGVLFGLTPAWHAANADLNTLLKNTSRASTGARPMLRKCLVAGELALATVLLIGASLLLQSLSRLQRVQLGFQSGGLLTFQLAPPQSKYPPAKAWNFYRELIASLDALPGVQGAAISSGIPLGAGNYTTTPMAPVGSSVLPAGVSVPVDWRIVSPDYFRVMQIPLLSGRTFTDQDSPTAQQVTIVSQETAKRFWGTENPVGQSLKFTSSGKVFTVVGVAAGVRNTSLSRELAPAVYLSAPARVWPLMDIVVRTSGSPEGITTAVRQKLRELDPELPASTVRTMEQWVSNNAAQPRLNAVLLAIFAGVALLIAAIGVYGVLSYSVTQRTREIGLRMALGAQQADVLHLIVREGMTVGLIGVGAGLLGAVAMSRALSSLLFGVQARDPFTFVGVAGLLTIVAFVACCVPAQKASRVDPLVALRDE